MKHRPLQKLLSVALLSAAIMVPGAMAQSPEEKGLEIAKERKRRDAGWGDSVADMSMILRNVRGQETVRKMRGKSFEVQDDGDKALTIFDQPKDVKGTAFLSFSHATVPDDQWIFLPAIKRVKRIASRNKSGPFMGSEFAFEDMTSFEIEKYDFTYLGDDVYEDMDMFMVQQTPKDKFSGYKRMIVWVDQEEYRAFKIEYYDRKDALLKTLIMDEFELYLDKYWRAHRAEMYNEQTGKSTELVTHSLEFQTGLSESDFNQGSLSRAR